MLEEIQLFAWNHKNAEHPEWLAMSEEYKSLEPLLVAHNKLHLVGDWCMTCCLCGKYQHEAVPTIVVLYEKKRPTWTDFNLSKESRLSFFAIQDKIISHHFPYHTNKVNASTTIGTHNSTGTLGGYLQSDDGKVMALTCAHCCDIPENTTYDKVLKLPPIQVQQPSLQSVTLIRNDTKVHEDNKKLLPNHHQVDFGIVRYGENTCEENKIPSIFDWVLIEGKHQRQGYNLFPLDHVGPKTGWVKNISSFTTMHHNETVWKKGMSGITTSGQYNGIPAIYCKYTTQGQMAVYLEPSEDSLCCRENIVIGINGPFSEPGDSGSFVLDQKGVCGMLWGGSVNHRISLVTNMDCLMSRISEATGKTWKLLDPPIYKKGCMLQ